MEICHLQGRRTLLWSCMLLSSLPTMRPRPRCMWRAPGAPCASRGRQWTTASGRPAATEKRRCRARPAASLMMQRRIIPKPIKNAMAHPKTSSLPTKPNEKSLLSTKPREKSPLPPNPRERSPLPTKFVGNCENSQSFVGNGDFFVNGGFFVGRGESHCRRIPL